MSLENSIRALLFALGAWGALFGPAWLPLVPMVLLSIRFSAWEVLLLGLLEDFLWMPGTQVPWFTVAAIIIVWMFEPLRKELLL